MTAEAPSVHASAVLAGNFAVLIRGAAGSSKSRLAMALIAAAETGHLRFARLIGDDRVHLEVRNGRLLVRPAPDLAGLIEVRGIGIRGLDYEPVAIVGLVVDLAAEDAERLPSSNEIVLAGVRLPRLALVAGIEPLPLVIAFLTTSPGDIKPQPPVPRFRSS